jgi:tRNA threonylcarbamoyladenosine biosynthesis protein TsaB
VKILAIDTSTDQASTALLQEDEIVAEYSWRAAGNHSRHLGSVVEEILDRQGFTPRSIDIMAIAIGPGSFSGLRVGISFAKGMATALEIPLYGESTLDVIADNIGDCVGSMWAVLPAGRRQLYAARYRRDGSTWRRTSDYQLLEGEQLPRVVAPGELVGGTGLPDALERAILDVGGRLTRPADRVRRAGYLAELARRSAVSGVPNQRDTIEPLYLRLSSAEERRAQPRQD